MTKQLAHNRLLLGYASLHFADRRGIFAQKRFFPHRSNPTPINHFQLHRELLQQAGGGNLPARVKNFDWREPVLTEILHSSMKAAGW